jgi:hypothetical protein
MRQALSFQISVENAECEKHSLRQPGSRYSGDHAPSAFHFRSPPKMQGVKTQHATTEFAVFGLKGPF